MGLIEILWTVTGVLVPLLLGTAWAMVGLTPPEFWIARGCIGLAAFIFGATALIWLSTSEWPNSARAFIAVVLGAAALVGFSESIRWVNAREHFVLSQKPDNRAETRAKLQECYVAVGPMIARQFPKETPDEVFRKYANEADVWMNNCANWIGENMGVPARERFLDRTGMMSTTYIGALNNEHNTIIQSLTRFRQNLLALIESGAWDKPPG